MKPKAVLAYCREKGIRSVDLRFVDLVGHWRHITFPVSVLSEASFEEGYGHLIVLDPSDTKPTYGVLVPQSEANYLDPMTTRPTLVLIASIQDVVTREGNALDSRQLAIRAVRYLESSALGDSHSVRPRFPFRLRSHLKSEDPTVIDSYLGCGPNDLDFNDRCLIADAALEAGVHIERHYCGMNSSSEMVLKPSSLVECCDDIMMLRYLAEQHATNHGASIGWHRLWMSSQWSILRQSDSILVGTSQRGLSDAGVYAIGGILKHADAIAAITASTSILESFPWQRACSEHVSESICRVSIASHHPRARSLEYCGIPANCNPYLVNSAVLMAMMDGLQNKISPAPGLDVHPNAQSIQSMQIGLNDRGDLDLEMLRQRLEEDRDFLCRGEVFSDELLDLLCRKLAQQLTTD